MAQFTDIDAFHRNASKRLDHWKQQVQIEHAVLVDEMVQVMEADVSGTVSTAELRRLGHPFGRRPGGRKRGRVANLPINKQSGDLLRSIQRPRTETKTKITYDVFFSIPYAKFVLNPAGTRKMVARGYWREITKQYKKRQSELIRRIRRSGLR